MLMELTSPDSNHDLAKLIQAEHALMLNQSSTKLFDRIPVCHNCFKIYSFMSDVYIRLEENLEKKDMEMVRRQKNSIFMGLDPALNEKVIQIMSK